MGSGCRVKVGSLRRSALGRDDFAVLLGKCADLGIREDIEHGL
jgi:hypothetical protein